MFLCQHSTIKRLKIRFGECIELKIHSPTLFHVHRKINASAQYIFRRDLFLPYFPQLIDVSGEVQAKVLFLPPLKQICILLTAQSCQTWRSTPCALGVTRGTVPPGPLALLPPPIPPTTTSPTLGQGRGWKGGTSPSAASWEGPPTPARSISPSSFPSPLARNKY